MFGEQAMVELVSAVGFYVMVAMALNAFDVSIPGGKKHWTKNIGVSVCPRTY